MFEEYTDLDDTLVTEELHKTLNDIPLKKETREEQRHNETFNQALVNSLEELEGKRPVDYTQEVVIGVPDVILDTSEDAKDFVKKVGVISREKRFGLPITLEYTPFTTASGEESTLINVVAAYSKDTNVKAVSKFLLK